MVSEMFVPCPSILFDWLLLIMAREVHYKNWDKVRDDLPLHTYVFVLWYHALPPPPLDSMIYTQLKYTYFTEKLKLTWLNNKTFDFYIP